MWNFVGKQNDIQGDYSNIYGNWLSGVNFIDEIRLGNQSNLDDDQKNNKARNTYFFLPFILGIIGLLYSYNRDLKTFWTLFTNKMQILKKISPPPPWEGVKPDQNGPIVKLESKHKQEQDMCYFPKPFNV